MTKKTMRDVIDVQENVYPRNIDRKEELRNNFSQYDMDYKDDLYIPEELLQPGYKLTWACRLVNNLRDDQGLQKMAARGYVFVSAEEWAGYYNPLPGMVDDFAMKYVCRGDMVLMKRPEYMQRKEDEHFISLSQQKREHVLKEAVVKT